MPGPVRESQALLDRYAELEAAAEAKRAARLKRQPLVLIAIVNALVLGIGITSTIDFRRLATPSGVSLRWSQATLFGDCDAYLHFSLPVTPDPRPRSEVCQVLRAKTKQARTVSASIGLRLHGAVTAGDSSTVTVDVSIRSVTTPVVLHLVRRSGRWLVLREAGPCAVVGCA